MFRKKKKKEKGFHRMAEHRPGSGETAGEGQKSEKQPRGSGPCGRGHTKGMEKKRKKIARISL